MLQHHLYARRGGQRPDHPGRHEEERHEEPHQHILGQPRHHRPSAHTHLPPSEGMNARKDILRRWIQNGSKFNFSFNFISLAR